MKFLVIWKLELSLVPRGGLDAVLRMPDYAAPLEKSGKIAARYHIVGAHVAIYDNVISGTGEGWLLATRCDRPTSRVADNVIRGVGAVTEGCTIGTNDVSP